MKKLTKLVINPEKVIKDDELKLLRGGYDDGTTCIKCFAPLGGDMCSVFLGSFYSICPYEEGLAVQMCQANYPEAMCAHYWCGANC